MLTCLFLEDILADDPKMLEEIEKLFALRYDVDKDYVNAGDHIGKLWCYTPLHGSGYVYECIDFILKAPISGVYCPLEPLWTYGREMLDPELLKENYVVCVVADTEDEGRRALREVTDYYNFTSFTRQDIENGPFYPEKVRFLSDIKR